MTESNSEITQSISGGNSKRKSLEKIIKSWMGRKAGKETITVSSMLGIPSSNIKMVPEANSESIGKKKFNGSSSSLNSIQHKLWNVVPKLKRESSCASLYQTKKNEVSSLRKCETMMALTNSTIVFEPIKPVNRLRNSATIITCSRCSSLLSLTATGSRYSLNFTNGYVAIGNTDNKIKCSRMPIQRTTSNVIYSCASKHNNYDPIRSGSFQEEVPLPEVLDPILVTDTPISELIVCKLCLGEFCHSKLFTISQCGCYFCDECMASYVAFEIMEGAYEISCPDALCPTQGIITLDEINKLVESQLIEKHKKYRLNREVELDKNRTWCPRAGCETVCLIDSSRSENGHSSTFNPQLSFAVQCPTCLEEFCSGCKKLWHPQTTCEENTRRLQANGQDDSIAFSFDTDLIKYCPMCSVPIEKDEGCAQMMCKRCKHVFCWYCLASLDDDFLLRHYDKGPCKNKLGHSRASVVWHRAQVIGIFAGFGILLLVASPLLLLAAPCIVCCKCRICSGTAKLEETDGEFDDGVTLKNKL